MFIIHLQLLPFTVVLVIQSILSKHPLVNGQPEFRDDADTSVNSGSGRPKLSYLPEDGWWQGANCATSCGGQPECQACGLPIDSSQAYDGTWHVATRLKGGPSTYVQIQFVGTEISVYCIVPAAKQGFTTRYALSFLLDKQPDGGLWSPNNQSDSSQTRYNVLVYHKAGLAKNFEHQLWVRAENDEADSIILFDYAKIVSGDGDDPTSTSVQSTSTPTATVSTTSTSKTTPSSASPSTIITTTPSSTRSTTSAIGSSSVTTLSSTLSSSSINSSISLASNTNLPSGTSATVFVSSISASPFPSNSLTSPPPSETQQGTSKRPSLVVILAAVFASLVGVTICIFAAIIYRMRRRRAAERSVDGVASYTLQSAETVSDQTTDDQDSTSLTPLRRGGRGRVRESKEPSFIPESEENLTTNAESSSRPAEPGGDSSAEIDFSAIPEEHEPEAPPPPYPGLDSDSGH